MAQKEVCVVGLGYIGLPTASLLATKGYRVFGFDINENVVRTINDGSIHIVEPSLDVLVRSAVQSGKLSAHITPHEAAVFIISVPTPLANGRQADLTFVEQSCRSIAPYLRPGNLIILESTVPVGTTEKIKGWLEQETGKKLFGDVKGRLFLAHCPERVLPGQILRELVENDRVIGGLDVESAAAAEAFYAKFVSGKIHVTHCRAAELCKLAENTYRDINIAYANELSNICEELELDVWEVIKLANRHPRVNILRPGPGVGGHCISTDPWFIVDSAPSEANLIKAAREINTMRPSKIVEKIKKACAPLDNPTIACLGLSFKANVDDMRESPAVEIVSALARARVGDVIAVEPNTETLPLCLSNVELLELSSALKRARVVVLLVDHDEFKEAFRDIEPHQLVIDCRGIWPRTKIRGRVSEFTAFRESVPFMFAGYEA